MARLRTASLLLREPRSLSDQVARKLEDAIVAGRFAFGENISEEKLAAAFGVSRTPVRDALNTLQFVGLVEVRPKRGSYVFNPTAAEIDQLWQYREILEREACALALQADPASLLADLRTTFDEMQSTHDKADIAGHAHLETAFHSLFFVHCGNAYLTDAYNLGAARIATIITLSNRTNGAGRQSSLEEHSTMLDSLAAHDLPRFNDTLTAHMRRTLVAATADLAAT